ncbi:uncharacterized protein LOC126674857 [Mercurialis annua]|uniref:uncharacterized protein LOC126674857 n=1 Tax=Mercurialis annua TaxID=3986 RepID=UPI0024AC86C2|nr:uncharacterized protein LOC126674857 [Mercurialis annua]
MSTLNVSFLIWFDGQIVNSPRGVEYHGGCRVEMPLSERMNFDELVNICKRAVCSGPNSTNSEVEITQILFRLPKFVRGEVDSYALFLVQDNNHLFGILTESMRCPNLRIMEFYVEYRILGGTEISLDNLELSDSSESEWDSESVRSSDEDEDEHFYESDEDDAGEIDAELEMANSGEQTHYQSQLPEHVSRVNVDDFVVDLNEGETPNFTWQPGMEFQTGMTFKSRDAVQTCATAYSIAMGKEHQFHRTTPKTIVFVCRHNEICGWWLRATKLQANHTWTLTKYIGPHTCDHFMTGRDHRNFKSNQIVEFIKDLVLEQRDIRIKTLMAGIWERFSVMPTYKRTWLAKEKAICSAYGNWKDSFAEVCSFMANVKVTNPGSFWHAEGDPIYTNHSQNPRVRMFRRMFWTFYPMTAGFPFLKPVLFVDGTHLYGKYTMTLLIASAIDGNNHIMPLAFALVESESAASYEYFLSHLREHVIKERKVAIISDRAGGIIAVLKRPEWAGVSHMFCIRHLASNFNTHFRDKDLKKLAEKAGRAYQKKKFTRYMKIMKIKSPDGYKYLMNKEVLKKNQWARAYDVNGQRHNAMTTNYAESVNATLKNIRGLPITAMIEAIFRKLVEKYISRWNFYKSLIVKDIEYTPICIQILRKAGDKSRTHVVQPYDMTTMTCEVVTKKNNHNQAGGNVHTVNLHKKKCTCGKFQQLKVPCSHAMAVCLKENLNPHDYIGSHYRNQNAIQAWSHVFHSLRDRERWIKPNDLPFVPNPGWARKKGRPVNQRFRNEMDQTYREDRSPNFCSKCGNRGHNARTCTNRIRDA